jgi:hypothetical protein
VDLVASSTSVVACTTCGIYWTEEDQPRCGDPAHDHQQFSVHRHQDQVVLAAGVGVTAVSFDPADPYTRDTIPDFGLYLDRRWQPPWPHDHLDWPDMGVPADPAAVLPALTALLDRARAGERVEVGCLGGHGRTGTALACLAVLTGTPADDAVEWVRMHYCAQAVETEAQEEFVLNAVPDRKAE